MMIITIITRRVCSVLIFLLSQVSTYACKCRDAVRDGLLLIVPRRQACLPDEASHQGPEARLAMITLFGDPEHWLGLSNKGWRCKRTWRINQSCVWVRVSSWGRQPARAEEERLLIVSDEMLPPPPGCCSRCIQYLQQCYPCSIKNPSPHHMAACLPLTACNMQHATYSIQHIV